MGDVVCFRVRRGGRSLRRGLIKRDVLLRSVHACGRASRVAVERVGAGRRLGVGLRVGLDGRGLRHGRDRGRGGVCGRRHRARSAPGLQGPRDTGDIGGDDGGGLRALRRRLLHIEGRRRVRICWVGVRILRRVLLLHARHTANSHSQVSGLAMGMGAARRGKLLRVVRHRRYRRGHGRGGVGTQPASLQRSGHGDAVAFALQRIGEAVGPCVVPRAWGQKMRLADACNVRKCLINVRRSVRNSVVGVR